MLSIVSRSRSQALLSGETRGEGDVLLNTRVKEVIDAADIFVNLSIVGGYIALGMQTY